MNVVARVKGLGAAQRLPPSQVNAMANGALVTRMAASVCQKNMAGAILQCSLKPGARYWLA